MKAIIDALKRARSEGRWVFVCGNGGSSATAEHFTNDLFSRGIKAVCLNSNNAIMTMIANDFGYDLVFKKQLAVYARQGDILITLSCSGTSKNVLEAKSLAEIIGMEVFEFETFERGKPRDFGKLEDKHLKMAHAISERLKWN